MADPIYDELRQIERIDPLIAKYRREHRLLLTDIFMIFGAALAAIVFAAWLDRAITSANAARLCGEACIEFPRDGVMSPPASRNYPSASVEGAFLGGE
ncbi:MAG: hypothetical protein DI533_00295 [Cereibacter sphaeroides]|uniref:Uncharacterized protein n=1 Tax=Cereibacter sphaeroides TaxID=1063 RepID=A0A2W5SEC6_CERSP|nr:MAG: hypothetical protein DI533_00295 [Cereibacter sphaeroides]